MNAVAIHVWHDEWAQRENGYRAYYSVSLIDEDGAEIRCIGGATSKREAMRDARAYVRQHPSTAHGLPVIFAAEVVR